MELQTTIKRTSSADKDFQSMIVRLDHEFWNELNEDMEVYDQFNKVPGISTVLVLYVNDEPTACGCFKEIDAATVEIKRMFVEKKYRGNGLSKKILQELERWAIEKGYSFAILETSIHFTTAQNLYRSGGYHVIPNYPPYDGLTESVCMKKQLVASSVDSVTHF